MIDVRDEQEENASSPIEVTLLGIVIDVLPPGQQIRIVTSLSYNTPSIDA